MRGIYVLIIQVDKKIDVTVGGLGKIVFVRGFIAYVGSAQINLEQRIKRHFRKAKHKFWHIDYLLDSNATKIIQELTKGMDKTEECKTAKAIGEKTEPILSFGCSDCKCKTHLFHIKDPETIKNVL